MTPLLWLSVLMPLSMATLFANHCHTFPPVEIICSFIGSRGHQCLRCPMALGCASRSLAPVRDLARCRLWPLCIASSDLQHLPVPSAESNPTATNTSLRPCHGDHRGYRRYIAAHCVETAYCSPFLTLSLATRHVSVEQEQSHSFCHVLPDGDHDVEYAIRRHLGLGFRPGHRSSLTTLEKRAMSAALHGRIVFSIFQTGGRNRELHVSCAFDRPIFQLRSLRPALSRRHFCYFCLAEETSTRCDTCTRIMCRYCVFTVRNGIACMGCAFARDQNPWEQRTHADWIQKEWYLGSYIMP